MSKCSKYSVNSISNHDLVVKRIVRYLIETAKLELRYESSEIEKVEKAEKVKFFEYIDSAHDDCLNSRKSTFEYIFFLWNESISWSSKRQRCVSTFTAEAEYVDECNAFKEVIFLVEALKEVGYEGSDTKPAIILTDNQAAIKMASNSVNHPRAKHIEIAYHYVRNKVEEGAIKIYYIPTDQMVADGLTKPLEPVKFLRSRSMMGLAPSTAGASEHKSMDIQLVEGWRLKASIWGLIAKRECWNQG